MAAENRKRKLEKDNNGGQQEDRLSSLPESILVDILSQLPLKSAISTSVLSTQLRRVWTQLTSVSIDTLRFPQKSDYYVSVDGLLNQLQSPVIHKFRLHFNYLFEPLYTNVENTSLFMDSWFRLICGRNVQKFQVSSGLSLSAAPPCIFRTQSLVMLELGHGFDYELLDAAEFNLPNLKKLQLKARVCNYEILANLIKSCPVLEDLCLVLALVSESKPFVFDIWGLNLKRLRINFFWYNDPHDVIINAPSLELFTVYDAWCSRFCFVEKPIGLLQAHIWGVLTISPFGTADNMRELYNAISHVRYLDLCHLELRPQTLFPNLTHLVVPLNHSTQCKELIDLLRCCPVLEDLILDHTNGKPMSGTWIAPQSAPPCLLTSLKRIEILRKSGFEKPFLTLLVKYFLNVAPFLEKVTLNVEGCKSGCKELNQRRELRFYKEICEYPMSFLHCRIEFSGLYIKASGNSKEVRRHDGCSLSLE